MEKFIKVCQIMSIAAIPIVLIVAELTYLAWKNCDLVDYEVNEDAGI